MSSPKTKSTAKSAVKKKQNKPKTNKPPFDKTAFVFNTPIENIEKALQRFDEQDADPMAEPFTKDELYWWIVWLNSLPDAKRRGLTQVPTCSIENAVLGLYDKTKRKKK